MHRSQDVIKSDFNEASDFWESTSKWWKDNDKSQLRLDADTLLTFRATAAVVTFDETTLVSKFQTWSENDDRLPTFWNWDWIGYHENDGKPNWSILLMVNHLISRIQHHLKMLASRQNRQFVFNENNINKNNMKPFLGNKSCWRIDEKLTELTGQVCDEIGAWVSFLLTQAFKFQHPNYIIYFQSD